MNTGCSIYIVDSDARVRRHLVMLLRGQDHKPTSFVSGKDFVEALGFLEAGISIIDMRLCDMDGLDVLRKTQGRRPDMLLIMMAANTDVRTAVQAIKEGADDFLEKPFEDDAIVQLVAHAIPELGRKIQFAARRCSAAKQLDKLTRKELHMMISLSLERDNGKVAEQHQVSVRTVESYRARIMRKVGVTRFSDALLLLSAAGVSRAPFPEKTC